jgi:hypothetical protein
MFGNGIEVNINAQLGDLSQKIADMISDVAEASKAVDAKGLPDAVGYMTCMVANLSAVIGLPPNTLPTVLAGIAASLALLYERDREKFIELTKDLPTYHNLMHTLFEVIENPATMGGMNFGG